MSLLEDEDVLRVVLLEDHVVQRSVHPRADMLTLCHVQSSWEMPEVYKTALAQTAPVVKSAAPYGAREPTSKAQN